MLEVCPSVAADRPSCEIHPLSIGGREDPVRLVFNAAEGPAVVVGLCDLGDRFRLTANAVDVIAPSQPLPQLPVARAVWTPRPSLAESAESWLLAGAPHHTVLSSAVDAETLSDFAAMTGVELLTIGADTTVEQLAKEIRWNAAYHRLAQAL
jgi:L-arabinose isomerase